MAQPADRKKEIKEYISSNINVFVEPLIYHIVKTRPSDPLQFAIHWLKDYADKKKRGEEPDSDSGEEDADDVAELQLKIQRKKQQGKSKSRIAISAEVMGEIKKRDSYTFKDIPKSEEAEALIRPLIEESVLFRNVDAKDEQVLINAMEEVNCQEDDKIITEGERGDDLFVVESGVYDCFKLIDGEETRVRDYQKGQLFGELALMYNAPRAASIVCKEPGTLYKLDRMTFNIITKSAARRKRDLYKSAIEKIDVFANISEAEKESFLDIMKEEKYQEGDYVIRQGEQGSRFYIVLEGGLIAEKVREGQEQPQKVYEFKEGDYFGQLALMYDVNRQASVRAESSARVAYLDRESFNRIFGSMEDMLKRNQDRYQMSISSQKRLVMA